MSSNLVPGTTNKHRSEIWGVKLKNDLSGTDGEAKMLIFPQQEWEYDDNRTNFWNEGAVMLKHNNKYYLMFSANSYATPRYALGYAVAESPLGPFVKFEGNPILSSIDGKVSGPGHNCVTLSPDGTELFCVYHSHYNLDDPSGIRMINIDRMGFKDNGELYIDGPSYSKQEYPAGAQD